MLAMSGALLALLDEPAPDGLGVVPQMAPDLERLRPGAQVPPAMQRGHRHTQEGGDLRCRPQSVAGGQGLFGSGPALLQVLRQIAGRVGRGGHRPASLVLAGGWWGSAIGASFTPG